MDTTTTSPQARQMVHIDGSSLRLDLEFTDQAVATYLGQFPEPERGTEAQRALAVGVHGLSSTGMRATVDDMRREVRRILHQAAAEAESRLDATLDAGRSRLVAELDPTVRTSLMARMLEELANVQDNALARLDPDRVDSHTARLVVAITDLLGPSGLLAERIEEAFDPTDPGSGIGRLTDVVERRFQELRDLVVGGRERESEAARGTAKGVAFEDEIEQLLRDDARSMGGCVVERTGRVAGDLGSQAMVGDFTITFPDGLRVVVEAKDAARVGLAGAGGILTELDRAMTNRNAPWALCISRRPAYPDEVGSFGVYGNRLLVVDEGDGVLTGVALRWIVAAARQDHASSEQFDAATVLDRIDRIRELAQHFSRTKKILTTAQAGLVSVREELDGLRGELLDRVDDIARVLHPAESGQTRHVA